MNIKHRLIILLVFLLCGAQFVSAEIKLLIITPQDKTIESSEKVQLIGMVSEESPKWVKINNKVIQLKNKRFSTRVPLDIGKNTIEVRAKTSDGEIISVYRRVLKRPQFPDIPPHFWAKKEIEDLATLGIVNPYYDGTFKPDKGVERAELAATLVKMTTTELPKVTQDLYPDVKSKYWGAPFIKVSLDKGYFTDYPDGTFKPLRHVTRAEGIAILLRFAGINEPKSISSAPYKDVPISHWASKAIYKAKEVGLIVDTLTFKPSDKLTRASLAAIIAKLPEVSVKISDLYNWESYLPKKKNEQAAEKTITYKPIIKAVTFSPKFIPADNKTKGTVTVSVEHKNGLSKIDTVALNCEPLGWGKNSQIFLWDDGKTYGDKEPEDGIFTGEIIVLNTAKPGSVRVGLSVLDQFGQTIESSLVLNVVSNINGMY